MWTKNEAAFLTNNLKPNNVIQIEVKKVKSNLTVLKAKKYNIAVKNPVYNDIASEKVVGMHFNKLKKKKRSESSTFDSNNLPKIFSNIVFSTLEQNLRKQIIDEYIYASQVQSQSTLKPITIQTPKSIPNQPIAYKETIINSESEGDFHLPDINLKKSTKVGRPLVFSVSPFNARKFYHFKQTCVKKSNASQSKKQIKVASHNQSYTDHLKDLKTKDDKIHNPLLVRNKAKSRRLKYFPFKNSSKSCLYY